MADFGSILKKLRAQWNMSQRDLADKVGVDFTYISKIENERLDPPSEEIIVKIAEVFGVDKYDLIIYADKVPSDFALVIKVDEEAQQYMKDKAAYWLKKMRKEEQK